MMKQTFRRFRIEIVVDVAEDEMPDEPLLTYFEIDCENIYKLGVSGKDIGSFIFAGSQIIERPDLSV